MHILIGLFAEPEGIAAKVLQSLGVTRDSVRTAALAARPADEPERSRRASARLGPHAGRRRRSPGSPPTAGSRCATPWR